MKGVTQVASHLSLAENEGPRTMVARRRVTGPRAPSPGPSQMRRYGLSTRTRLASLDASSHTALHRAPLVLCPNTQARARCRLPVWTQRAL